MTETTDDVTADVTATVTVRYFAAARAAAGMDAEVRTLPAGARVADLLTELSAGNPELDRVLQQCSYLCDGTAVRDVAAVLESGQTLDVLPPFAGG